MCREEEEAEAAADGAPVVAVDGAGGWRGRTAGLEGQPMRLRRRPGRPPGGGEFIDKKLNHADFILPCGYFDICQFYEATRFLYPGLANTFLGKLGHHSCQEADCETLFSMSGYKSEARRLNSLCRTYERLVIASHRMHRFHIRDQVIIDAYMDRVRNNDWDDEENRDDEEFLKLEEELWSKMYPEQAHAVEAVTEGVVDKILESIVDNQPANEMKASALCDLF